MVSKYAICAYRRDGQVEAFELVNRDSDAEALAFANRLLARTPAAKRAVIFHGARRLELARGASWITRWRASLTTVLRPSACTLAGRRTRRAGAPVGR